MNERKLLQSEIAIAWVLRVGVMACGVIIALGLFSRLFHIGAMASESNHQMISELMSGQTLNNYQPTANPVEVGRGIFHWDADTVMIAGLLLLIGLPIARVALTVIIFFHERDWPFMAITTIVLTVLLSGIFLGRAL